VRQNKHKIGILGCGWLGTALAKKLISNQFTVKGTTTKLDKINFLENLGIKAFQIEFKPNIIKGDFDFFLKNLDILIISLPPRLGETKFSTLEPLQKLFCQYDFSHLKKLLYTSSTSVFANGINKFYNENTLPNNKTPRAKTLIDLENLILNQNKVIKEVAILRLGGLFDENGRHPIYYLSGKHNLPNPKAPVNLIEKRDAVNLLYALVNQKISKTIFHGVNPKHPLREKYYVQKAKSLNLDLPEFDKANTSQGKTIHSKITEETLQFKFQFNL